MNALTLPLVALVVVAPLPAQTITEDHVPKAELRPSMFLESRILECAGRHGLRELTNILVSKPREARGADFVDRCKAPPRNCTRSLPSSRP